MTHALSREDIEQAARRIAGHVHRTPLMRSDALDAACGTEVFVKCENLQKVGAFKARGATNALFTLSDDELARGVATHSSGNHGAALAYAAGRRGVPAHVVMPKGAPAVKVRAVQGYGASVHRCDNTLAARESALAGLVETGGQRVVHPYDDPLVVAGQGTIALELLDDLPGLRTMLAPVGGGGLISGLVLGAAGRAEVIGAEPRSVDDAARSMTSGKHQPAPMGHTIADGLRTRLGGIGFDVLRNNKTRIWTVDEDEILRAMRFVWERMKLVIEPSAAVPVAALMNPDNHVEGPAAIVLSGGNVDLDGFFDTLR